MSEELQVTQHESNNQALSISQLGERVKLIHDVLIKAMKENTHYGKVPGCGNKCVLLKPGADMLAMMFKLVPQYKIERTDMDGGHREFDVTCTMYSGTGEMLGQGVGSASTMEKKYRYRKDEKGNKVENEDIADVYNTVLKMAKKRAHVDATLTVTGAADIFTQDLIENEDEPQRPPVAMPTAKQADKPQPERGKLDNVGKYATITGPQAKRLWAIAKNAGVSEDDLRAYVAITANVEHIKDIPPEHYDAICKWCENGGQESPAE